jgi:DNA-binding response OmpR family regulator
MSGRPKILVVDDDAFIRRPLAFMLREEGFQPVVAADADECMKSMAEVRPDLIILDVMMPGRDGFELCKTLKRDEHYAAIPIILLSARGQEHDRERGLCLGAADFMTKPYSPVALLRRVRQILARNLEPID